MSRQHWIALDAVFSRTLSADDIARARRVFCDYVEAVNDVSVHHLLTNPPDDMRATASALTQALQAAWRVPER